MASDDSVDIFLWALHGSNVSSQANYIKYDDFKFESLAMYTDPFNIGWSEEMNLFMNDPCSLLVGKCPYIPILNSHTNKKEVYIPPLIFGVSEKDATSVISQQIGLYHFKIKKKGIITRDIQLEELNMNYNPLLHSEYTGKDQCEIVETQKVMSYQDLKERHGTFEQNKTITYSMLFQHILDYCKNMHFNPANVSVGIFSCQVKDLRYVEKYDQTNTKSLVPRIKLSPSLTETKIYTNRETPPQVTSIKISPTIVNFQSLKPWKALGNLKHQGCGLNVLAYYGILPENEAREKAVCLNLNGTPIYQIVNYIHHAYNNNQSYMIIRYPLSTGIEILYDFIAKYNANFAIIFKMYDTELQNNTRKYSQRGHTASIGKLNNEVYFFDPQVEETPINLADIDANQLTESIKDVYHKHYIDIIYTLRPESGFDQNRPKLSYTDFTSFVQKHHGKYISKGETVKSPSYNADDLPDYVSPSSSKGGTRIRTAKSRTAKSRTVKSRTAKSRTTKSRFGTTKKASSIKKIVETKDGKLKIFGDYFEINKEMDKAAGVTTFVKPT